MTLTTSQPAARVAYPLRVFLDLSVGHLTPTTRRWLDTIDWGDISTHAGVGGKTTYGWLLYVPEEPEDDDKRPADLAACLAYARAHGAEYVLFDADAVEIECLPVYDEDSGASR